MHVRNCADLPGGTTIENAQWNASLFHLATQTIPITNSEFKLAQNRTGETIIEMMVKVAFVKTNIAAMCAFHKT